MSETIWYEVTLADGLVQRWPADKERGVWSWLTGGSVLVLRDFEGMIEVAYSPAAWVSIKRIKEQE